VKQHQLIPGRADSSAKGGIDVETWAKVLALSIGGVAGVNARYWLGIWINRWAGSQFPWATFTINVSGSFAIGFLTALLARSAPHSYLRLLLVVGFLGGYTTFSTFAFESVTLWQRGERVFGLTNMFGSIIAGCAAVVCGAALAERMARPSGSPVRALRQSTAPSSILQGLGSDQAALHRSLLDPERLPAAQFDPGEPAEGST
jgi:CrcB protein